MKPLLRETRLLGIVSLVLTLTLPACHTTAPSSPRVQGPDPGPEAMEMLDDVQKRTFFWFWDTTNPGNGLVPDRWPSAPFSSIAAVGFGLTAYPVGVERGWITREQARERVLTTLQFFANAPRGMEPRGMTGHHGFFYHFLNMDTGERHGDTELSSIDTTLLLAGALFCQSYFDQNHPDEARIREIAEKLYLDADWTYFLEREPLVTMSWRPERGFSKWDWRGLNEGAILYILALASPTHPVDESAWDAWTSTYQWRDYYGYEHVNFGPLFGHQYSHVWIDFRGIQDEYLRGKGIDFFENSRRAVLSQRAYAIDNPNEWRDYGENIWGLTACDGPGGGTATIEGKERRFHGYLARAAAATEVRDDGTIAPTAAAASLPFAPEVVIPAIAELQRRYGDRLYQQYGFLDAFNPTFRSDPGFMGPGTLDPELGWFDADYLGIDQGPIVLMIENHRTGLLWRLTRHCPYLEEGLRRAGFAGGWL